MRQMRTDARNIIFNEISKTKLDQECKYEINQKDYEKNCDFVSKNIDKIFSKSKLDGWSKK